MAGPAEEAARSHFDSLMRVLRYGSPKAMRKRLTVAREIDWRGDMTDSPARYLTGRGDLDDDQLRLAEAYRGLRVIALGRPEPEILNYRHLIATFGIGTDKHNTEVQAPLTEAERAYLAQRFDEARSLLRLRGGLFVFTITDSIVVHEEWRSWVRVSGKDRTPRDGRELKALREGLEWIGKSLAPKNRRKP